ncbi:zinc finger and SCAN domain-containing protein 22-like isoform X3 [Poecilia reticulata]|uniref:zinc finger and SCAN domain-containing protein 22-like isoform X2 n=1 Tax=Poecilia reticulata TaxID=8081 RepID=UPI0004A23173|nr:PREDICTED: zinc finger and SCAN domain-containing protein 22-like isoform X2 [Poecilia reticulata]XP_008404617.1 PREDICTED: zinc finger and SCAN domain-containing protein 22-like isoform X3 [Poecilia reticulata]
MSNAIRIKEEEEEPELQQMAETKEEPEPEPTKEEHIELWVFQKEGQMLVMQKTNTSVATPTHEEMLDNMPGLAQVMETKEEPEPVLIKEEQVDPCRDQNEVQLDLHIKLDTDSITVTSADEQNNSSDPEPNKNQLLPANRPEPENQEDSGRGDPSLRPDKRRQDTRSNGVNVNSSELKRQKTDTASCEICGKLFRMRQHLPDNIKIHTGEKLHPCEVCGKAFRRRGHSNKNKRICTSETPKTYKLFGKTSSDQAGKVENTREKLHPCEVCGKAFKACDRLPHHLQKRRGEKPFSSQTCGKSFTWNSSALHTRSHGEKPLPCEVCGKHFK